MTMFFYIDLLGALIYVILAVLLGIHSDRRLLPVVLVGACMLSAAWSAASALAGSGSIFFDKVENTLDVLRLGAWIFFVGLACRAGLPEVGRRQDLHRFLVVTGALVFLVFGLEVATSVSSSAKQSNAIVLACQSGRLLFSTAGLLLVILLLRQRNIEQFWRIRYLCFGLGGILAYELFASSEGVLLLQVLPLSDYGRGLVSFVAAPLIAISTAHNPDWSVQLNLSRRAVLDSLAIAGVGIYLIILASVSMFLPAVGGEWTPALQAIFFLGATVLFAVLVGSRKTRFRFNRWLSRYLFTFRHDYREQWRHFSRALSSAEQGEDLRMRAFAAIAAVVECEDGGLWLRELDLFLPVVNRNLPEDARDEPDNSPFVNHLETTRDRILEIARPSEKSKTEHLPWLPDWMAHWNDAWLLVPLFHRDVLIGFIALGHRDPPLFEIEDEELLQTAALHVASSLAEDQAATALEEARRFEVLSRSMAFIAHDLRNVANEMSLTFSNAKKHIGNPEFQVDMLQSMGESLARLQRLLDRVGDRSQEMHAAIPVDLVQFLGESLRRRFSERSSLHVEVEQGLRLPIVGDPDNLMAISGHLIQNAIDATDDQGQVVVRLRQEGRAAVFEVEDDGPGMSAEFVQERLYHPFSSNKVNGMGLGLFECRQLARKLNGHLEIDSEPSIGTTARLRLPLAMGNAVVLEQEAEIV